MICRVEDIVKHSYAALEVVHRNGDTRDIITTILQVDQEADKWIDNKGAECLRGATNADTLYNVWAFVRRHIRYKADAPGFEKVQTPGAAMRATGAADCKSMSISIVALLRALGFSGIRYRFTSYDPDTDFTHVYVVVRASGKDWILDASKGGRFDGEPPYFQKKDVAALAGRVSGIQGGARVSGPIETAKNIGIGILMIWIVSKIFEK